MRYCNNCKKELGKKEETFRDGICTDCYFDYLFEKIENYKKMKDNPPPEKEPSKFSNAVNKFLKKITPKN